MSDTYVVNSVGNPVIIKDDKAVLDYTFDWSAWLAPLTDTISTIVASINNPPDNSLVVSSSGNTTTTATIWLSGGTIGQTYQVECEITTADNRTDERSIYVKIKDR